MQIIEQKITTSDCGKFKEIYSLIEKHNGEIVGIRHFGEAQEKYDALEEMGELELAESTPEGNA
jgi:hypothetical protein